MKLGKLPPKYDKRTLRIEKYLTGPLPPPPAAGSDWTDGISSWGMMANDQYGDCTCAAIGHAIQAWTLNETGKEITVTDSDVLALYSAVSGFNLNDPVNTDNGANMLDVLNTVRRSGLADRKIYAYAAVDPTNTWLMQTVAWLFGGVYAGISLPMSAQTQLNAGGWWTVPRCGLSGPGTPGSWGGHAVYIPKVIPSKKKSAAFTCVTWSALQGMAPHFVQSYMDECYAVIGYDWVAKDGRCPNGFDLAALEKDLRSVTA